MPKFKSKRKENKTSKNIKELFSKTKERLKWLDPFTYVDLFVMPKVKQYNDSEIVETIVNIIFAAIFAFLIYTILGFLFGSNTPLVIVYSESMQPNLFRGDVIALSGVNQNNYFGPEVNVSKNIENEPVNSYVTVEYEGRNLSKLIFENNQEVIPNKEGEILVYNSNPYNLPIIHRSIVKINALDGEYILTKGDNELTNPTFDADCGNIDILRGQSEKPCVSFYASKVSEIEGVAFFRIPALGCVKLWLVDNTLSLITTGSLPREFNGIC
jgi:signal peptidase I